MKKQWMRILSLLMALMLVLPSAGGMTALAEEEEIFPEDSIVEMPDEGLNMGEDEAEGVSAMVSYGTVEGETEEGSSEPIEGEELSLGADTDFDEVLLSPQWEGDDTLSAGSGLSSARLTASHSSITINKGNTSTVTFAVSNFTGFFYLEVLTNNTTAYTYSWGEWNSTTKIPLRITAKAAGSGRITVRLRAPNDSKIYATVYLNVTVPNPESGTLKLSSSSQAIYVGDTYRLNVTVSYNVSCYLSYSNSNSSAANLSWGSWSGSTIPLSITGKAAGSGKVTIQLKSSSTNKVLDTKEFSYSIAKKQNPEIVFSPTSVSVYQGKSQKVNVTAKGYSGSYQLKYSTSNSSAYSLSWGSWSGNTIPLTVTGKNKGSGTITVYMYSSSGSLLTSKTLSVSVLADPTPPKVTVSSSSLSFKVGETKSVTCAYANVSESIYLQYSTTNTSAYSLSWGSWSGGKIPLKITGKAAGSGTVTVYLKRSSNNATLASAKISVTITPGTNGWNISSAAYNFYNYSTTIPLSTCQILYGNTQYAKAVYNANIGNGGVCYGMATTSGILITNNSINPSSFRSGASVPKNLSKTDYSSSLKVNLKTFIEAMHVAQVSDYVTNHRGLSSLVSTVKSEIAAKRPVAIGVRGYYNGSTGGHRVLAIGYTETSTAFKIRIYDSNWGTTENTLTINKSGSSYTSWSYPFTSSVIWGTGKTGADIYYTPYSEYMNAWNQRKKRGTDQAENMIVTRNNNFTLKDFNGNIVAKYENGKLVQSAGTVREVIWDDLLLNGTAPAHPHVLYVPVDYYTVENGSAGSNLTVTIVDEMLSTTVTTNADTFGFCADDSEDTANATLTPLENMEFSITIGSSKPGDPAETKLEGLGTGEPISMALSGGVLSITGEGLCTLSQTGQVTEYFISASAGNGGTISPDGVNSYEEGSCVSYEIKPDPGYVVRTVYVDGVNVGSMLEYAFDDIQDSHSIDVEFACDIAQCEVALSQTVVPYTGEALTPDVTVTAPDGTILLLNDDYDVYYEDNTEIGTATVYVIGAMGSAWYGSTQVTFTISEEQNAITDVTFAPADNTVQIGLMHTGAVRLIVALYNADGSMKTARIVEAAADQNVISAAFTDQSVPSGARIKVFMTDDQYRPLCASYTYTVD